MDDQKAIIESLAMDLKRLALSLYRGSFAMADRFKEEALKRSQELENQNSSSYLKVLIQGALMYSTLFQNFALKKRH